VCLGAFVCLFVCLFVVREERICYDFVIVVCVCARQLCDCVL